MTPPLKLSRNELAALLKSVFQACFGHSQDWAAMAHSVLWLEAHGFDGHAMLMDAMDEEMCLAPFAGDIQDVSTGYIVDFNGGHAILAAHMMADLAVEAALRHGTGTIKIKGAAESLALIAALPRCAKQGFAAQVTGREYDAHIFPRDDYPSLYQRRSEAITLTCAAEIALPKGKCLQPAGQLQSHYQKTLMNGLAIDPGIYRAFMKVADRTLVEASEASRKGAGE